MFRLEIPNDKEYEYHMMYVWDRLEKLLKYEHKELTYELFEEILNYDDFDIDGVNVSISQYRHYEKLLGKNMFDDMCNRYKDYRQGLLDKEVDKVNESKKRLYRMWRNMEIVND